MEYSSSSSSDEGSLGFSPSNDERAAAELYDMWVRKMSITPAPTEEQQQRPMSMSREEEGADTRAWAEDVNPPFITNSDLRLGPGRRLRSSGRPSVSPSREPKRLQFIEEEEEEEEQEAAAAAPDLFDEQGFSNPQFEGTGGGEMLDLVGPAREQEARSRAMGKKPPGEEFKSATELYASLAADMGRALTQLAAQLTRKPIRQGQLTILEEPTAIIIVWGKEPHDNEEDKRPTLYWRYLSHGSRQKVRVRVVGLSGKITESSITLGQRSEEEIHHLDAHDVLRVDSTTHVIIQAGPRAFPSTDDHWTIREGGARTTQPVIFLLINQKEPGVYQALNLHTGEDVPIHVKRK
jgi:hypothetical protein